VSALAPLRRRGFAPAAVALVALAGGALVASALLEDEADEPGRATRAGAAAAEVSRRTLVARETVDGTLGYARSRTVFNRLGAAGDTPAGKSGPSGEPGSDPGGGEGAGTITWMARPGSVVERGEALFRVDDEPVLLLYGGTPAYRDLEPGVSDGPDVLQLERNLSALGYDPGWIDETFTASTAAAVAAWRDALGLPEGDGLELGRVAFLPGPRRVGQRIAAPGDPVAAGAEVLDTSSTERVVNIELDASLQSLAERGQRVEVTLPNGSTARGRISNVGRVARELEAEGGDPAAEPQLVVDVTVKLRSDRGLGRLDEAPVQVGLAQETRRNVLAVPVDALVARRGGGYGVELAGGRRIVPVRTGLFADGYVEVRGAGLRAGTRVVVPGE
jgi:hypothetical protein